MSNALGYKIRKLRKEVKKLTLEELAEKTDSSKGYIWELENRDTRKPSAEKLMKIAEVLGVTIEFLLDNSKLDPDDSVMKAALYRNFNKLDKDYQQRFMKIIEIWGNKSARE